jgi:hypothetical protein
MIILNLFPYFERIIFTLFFKENFSIPKNLLYLHKKKTFIPKIKFNKVITNIKIHFSIILFS